MNAINKTQIKHCPPPAPHANKHVKLIAGSLLVVAGVVSLIAAGVFTSLIFAIAAPAFVFTGTFLMCSGLQNLNKDKTPKPLPFRPGVQGPVKNAQTPVKNAQTPVKNAQGPVKNAQAPVKNVHQPEASAPPSDQELVKAALVKKDWKEAIQLTELIHDKQDKNEALIKIAIACDSVDPKVWSSMMKKCADEDTKVMVLHAADSQLKTTEVLELMESNINPERWIKIIAAMIPNQSNKPNSKTIQKHLLISIAVAYLNRDNQYATNMEMLHAILDKIEDMLKKDNTLEGYLKHFEANPNEALNRFCLAVAWHENPPANV